MSMNLAVGLSFGLFAIVSFLIQVARAHLSGELDISKKQNSTPDPYMFDNPHHQVHHESAQWLESFYNQTSPDVSSTTF